MSAKLLMLGLVFTLIFSSTLDAKEKKETHTTPGSAIFVMAPIKEITVTTQTLKETNEKGSIDLAYPQVIGLSNQAFENDINRLIEERVETNYATIKKRMDTIHHTVPYQFISTFEVKDTPNNLLTLGFFDYAYTGGTYGVATQNYLTIDLDTDEILTLQDLFNSNTYNYQLKYLVGEQINGRTQSLTITGDEVFYINKNQDLVLVFNVADVETRGSGILEIILEKQTLEDYRFQE